MSSSPEPDPPQPAPDPAPPAPEPPAPAPNDLSALVDRLASFDPGDIGRRLDELEQRLSAGGGDQGPADFAGAIRDALEPFFTDVGKTFHDALESLKALAAGGTPPPSDSPPGPAPPAQQRSGSGLLDKLFDTPVIPPGP